MYPKARTPLPRLDRGERAAAPPTWQAAAAPGVGIAAYSALEDKHLKFSLSGARASSALDATRGGEGAEAALQRLRAQQARYDSLAAAPLNVPPPITNVIAPKRDPALNVRPEEIFIKARDRLLELWDLLGIDDAVRSHFYATAFLEVTSDNLGAMHAEIERLLDLRAREQALKAAVEVREGFLYLLQDLTERTLSGAIYEDADGDDPNVTGGAPAVASRVSSSLPAAAAVHSAGGQTLRPLPPTAAREVRNIVTKLRKANFDVINAVEAWRTTLGYDAVWLWRGGSYVLKMMSDCAFIAAAPAVSHAIGCLVVGNPLLDPSRTPEMLNAAANISKSVARLPATFRRAGTLAPVSFARSASSAGAAGASPAPAVSNRDKYDTAMRVLQAEPTVWKLYSAAAKRFDFAPLDDAEVDSDVVQSAYEDCFFHCPDEFTASARKRVVKDLEDRMHILARVIKIQRAVRRMLSASKAKVLAKRDQAATKLQSHVRRWLAVAAVERRRRQVHAAVKLQALARGVSTRRHRETTRATDGEATTIQRVWRGHRDRARVLLLRAFLSRVISIQAAIRGALVRARIRRADAARKHHAAAQLQRVWRGGAVRASAVASPAKLRAAIRLQCWARRVRALRQVAALLELRRRASLIQRCGRALETRMVVGRQWRDARIMADDDDGRMPPHQ